MKGIYTCSPKRKIGKVPCQNCGVLVDVMLPFIGCVSCEECQDAINNITADAAEFKRRTSWAKEQE